MKFEKWEKNIFYSGIAGFWFIWGYRMVRKYILSDPALEIDVLARTLWGEARGEGVEGMIAVANVVKNRVIKGGWWGTTYIDVCKKNKQFSVWNPNDPNLSKMLTVTDSDYDFKTSLTIAKAIIMGDPVVDNTNGATHYHTKQIRPYWANEYKKVATIGNHIFYT